MQTRRRFLQQFLRTAGCAAATACLPFRPGAWVAADEVAGDVDFPQGVASADPQPDAVMLWVRAVPADGSAGSVAVTVQVSADPEFAAAVIQQTATVTADSDHTLRFFAQGLQPDTIYFYRFLGRGAVSPLGRTRTAPRPDADRRVNFAWVSCQHYELGFYSAWRRMIADDEAAPAEEQIDFVLHVGDFIYEVAGVSIRDGEFRALHGDATYLRDHGGADRTVLPFPSGGRPGNYGGLAAATLEDYRHLYRRYLSDPHLQAARARWPFICTWDDHEFADNCWQGHTTQGAFQSGRLAANRAWFEYVPAVLTGARSVDGVQVRAHDFHPVVVADTPFGDLDEPAADQEPNNTAAISSLTIFRSLQFGKHVDLLVADTRSYRSDQCVPEWWVSKYFRERSLAKTPELVAMLDAGRDHDGGRAPAEITNNGVTAPNPRRDSPRGTMLGAQQKAWWKESLARSTRTWKFWANSVSALPLTLDFDSLPFAGRSRIVMNDDMWDGYPGEREELLSFLRHGAIRNVISLSGDLHAHLAGTLMTGFHTKSRAAVCPEFVVAGISSASMYRTLRSLALIEPKPGEAPGLHGLLPFIGEDQELLNNSIANGTFSSLVYRRTGSRWLTRLARNGDANSHFAYVDTNAVGYGVVNVTAERCAVTLVTVQPPLRDLGAAPAPVLHRARFEVTAGDPAPRLLELKGRAPFPL